MRLIDRATTYLLGATLFLTSYFWYDNDYFWHLRGGIDVLSNGLPFVDKFSWSGGERGYYWFMHEWLYDVLIAFGYLQLGHLSTLLITLLLYMGLFLMCCKHVQKYIPGLTGSLVTGLLFYLLFCFEVVITGRPQVFSYLFFTVLLLLVLDMKNSGICWKHIFLIFGLNVIWANVHGGASIVSFAVLGIYGLSEVWTHRFKAPYWRLTILAAASIAGIMINPHGYKLFMYAIQITGDPLSKQIVEWNPTVLTKDVLHRVVIFFIPIVLLLLAFRKQMVRKLDPFVAMMTVFMMYSFLDSVRHFIMFGLTIIVLYAELLPLVVDPIRRGLSLLGRYLHVGLARILLRLGLIAICGVAAYMCHTNFKEHLIEQFPVKAINWMVSHNETGRVFNSYNWGGYMVFENVPTFIDGRTDIFMDMYNHSSIYKDYLKAYSGLVGFRHIETTYAPDRFLLDKQNSQSIISILQLSPNYESIYEDDIAVLYKKID